MKKPQAGQIWCLDYKEERLYYFVTATREEDRVFSGWVYWNNMNEDFDSDASMDWFINNCSLVSG